MFKQPEPPELTVEALTRWLRSEPDPEREYRYQDPVFCLLGQYFTDCGAMDAISEAAYETMPHYREIAEPKPHTFGAALARAEQLLLPPPAQVIEPPFVSETHEPVAIEHQGHS